MPTVIETSVGLDRTMLALLCRAYDEEKAATAKEGMDEDTRIVLHLPARVAPIQVAVLPMSKKLKENAYELYKDINRYFRSEYDETGSIGKRYRRQDEIGTPYCITFDFDSVNDNAVTVRNRDTMQQDRVNITQLRDYLENKIGF
jgi:glycyl-tRNA synthetase